MISIETKFSIGDKIIFNLEGAPTVGIIESVSIAAKQMQTEWPLLHHPETGVVKTFLYSETYTLKMRSGIFMPEDLQCGKNIKNNSVI